MMDKLVCVNSPYTYQFGFLFGLYILLAQTLILQHYFIPSFIVALIVFLYQVGAISKSDPGVSNRIPLCYAVYLPTIPALRKQDILFMCMYRYHFRVSLRSYLSFHFDFINREYGELLVSCGYVGEAITIFESLELWDNLIYCYW